MYVDMGPWISADLSGRNKGLNQREHCFDHIQKIHDAGIEVIGSFAFGFDHDDPGVFERTVKFAQEAQLDEVEFLVLTPYPKTGIRQHLLDQGLVTNPDDFSTYNGIWANVRTRHLDADTLQYLVWYHRQIIMGWWEPSPLVRAQGPVWTGIWLHFFRPFLKVVLGRLLRRHGWRGRYEREIARLKGVNRFADLD
jgi:radical SAM superfamily enzyme YgiQ (UPF0313 family)